MVDKARHGLRLANHSIIRPDLLVDSHDAGRAVEVIRANTAGQLRFGLDTTSRETAAHLLSALSSSSSSPRSWGHSNPATLSPPATPPSPATSRAHLVGLTGLPKGGAPKDALFHTVPIKLFHDVPDVGRSLVRWLERLLKEGLISAPEIIDIEEGLDNVNKALDRMRRGEIRGGKLVVRV